MQYAIAIGFTVFDYLSGTAAAIYNHECNSSIMRQGLFHKLAILAVYALVALFDFATNYIDLGTLSQVPISGLVCVGFSIMEIQSVLENLHRINSEIPSNFSSLLSINKGKE